MKYVRCFIDWCIVEQMIDGLIDQSFEVPIGVLREEVVNKCV
jgi:hypothetical protein